MRNKYLIIIVMIITIISITGCEKKTKKLENIQSSVLENYNEVDTSKNLSQERRNQDIEVLIENIENEKEQNEWDIKVLKDDPIKTVLQIKDKKGEDVAQVEIGVNEAGVNNPDFSNEIESNVKIENDTNLNKTDDVTLPPSDYINTNKSELLNPQNIKTYEDYKALTDEHRLLFYYSFASADEFWIWYNVAKEEYESKSNEIVIDEDGIIDLEEND